MIPSLHVKMSTGKMRILLMSNSRKSIPVVLVPHPLSNRQSTKELEGGWAKWSTGVHLFSDYAVYQARHTHRKQFFHRYRRFTGSGEKQ